MRGRARGSDPAHACTGCGSGDEAHRTRGADRRCSDGSHSRQQPGQRAGFPGQSRGIGSRSKRARDERRGVPAHRGRLSSQREWPAPYRAGRPRGRKERRRQKSKRIAVPQEPRPASYRKRQKARRTLEAPAGLHSPPRDLESLRDSGRSTRRNDLRGARRRLGYFGSGGGSRLGGKAALERPFHSVFDRGRRFTHHFRDLGNDEEFGSIEHTFFAKREALRLREKRKALEHISHFVDRAAAHLVRVVLEPAFPILVIVDLPVPQQPEETFYFSVADGPPEPNAVNVGKRNEHDSLVRDDPQMVEPTGSAENCFLLDPLDYS